MRTPGRSLVQVGVMSASTGRVMEGMGARVRARGGMMSLSLTRLRFVLLWCYILVSFGDRESSAGLKVYAVKESG